MNKKLVIANITKYNDKKIDFIGQLNLKLGFSEKYTEKIERDNSINRLLNWSSSLDIDNNRARILILLIAEYFGLFEFLPMVTMHFFIYILLQF
jgi:hypothetical protein